VLDQIILDMDGVLYDWEGCVGQVMVRDGFLLATPERVRTWKVEWMTPEMWRHYGTVLQDVFSLGFPLPYALDGAEFLRTLTDSLEIVTGGEEETAEYKKLWLAENGIEYDKFTLIPRESDKSQYVRSANALVIDDNAGQVDAVMLNTPAKAIIFDQRYNRGPEAPKEMCSRMFRAHSWSGVVRIAAWIAQREEALAGA
jgi:hypothetical protein